MELSVSKNRISPNEMQRSTIFGNLINNNEENGGGKTLENEKNKEIKKEENKIIENKNSENKILVIQDYYEGGITNLKATNNNTYKIKMFQTFKATKLQTLFYLVIPHNKEIILSSLKLNISMSLIGVIMGEFLVSKKGIGYLIMYGSQVFNLDLVMTGIFILCIVATLLYVIMDYLTKRFVHYE